MTPAFLGIPFPCYPEFVTPDHAGVSTEKIAYCYPLHSFELLKHS